jgi:hypothetical protein
MLAYHNDPKIKQDILAQLQLHYDADEIIKGVYWENGKGCAVGCTLHGQNHKEYENRFGIPRILAKLKDTIFEGLPNAIAKKWPIRFMNAIQEGTDLSKVWNKFALFLLNDPKYGVINYASTEESKVVIQNVINLYKKSLTEQVSTEEWKTVSVAASYASYAAYDAAYAASSYAYYASYAAAYAAYAASSYAYYASYAAAYAAYASSADDAATSAAYASDDADDADDTSAASYAVAAAAAAAAAVSYDATDSSAQEKHFIAQSDELIRLLHQEN